MKSKPSSTKDAAPVKVEASSSVARKPVRRPFPGPRGAQARLRVGIDRQAHAELLAHAKESLHAEVCGVLVGEEGVDDEGGYVHVQAVIRGAQASGGSTHVTFTHETWDAIHKVMEKDHAKQQMVGWYHTHPGFGVEFSEMDLFIQRNFFSSPSQIALVTDPVGGTVAIAMNTGGGGVEYLPRYWVDGREHPSLVPASAQPEVVYRGGGGGDGGSVNTQSLEQRLNQTTLALEDLRNSLHRFLLFMGGLAAIAMVGMVTWFVREQFRERVKPPEINGFVPVPIRIGDKDVLVGLGVVKWEVPDELNALMLEVEKQRLEDEKAAKGAAGPAPAPESKPTEAKPGTEPPPTSKPPEAKSQPPAPEAAPPATAAPPPAAEAPAPTSKPPQNP